ncbi:hypothetical protein STCU_11043 [Strigomonas culicis]|uniref:Post-transcriptional regulator MKT1 C-terminal domain-containing protein n=1 Tax=Strigomonas culicis TaxID=28005 RepID=S9TIK7_9TRYP|nr:hypothetical protein STCU_11043 [Strigomonas culicis]|eukprot:EPY16714.1 hypothetical protein STCU_11043 [Strigomonas culicis]
MCSRLVNQSLRVLTEVISSLLFTQGRTNLPISQFNNVVALLPFKCPVEIAAGNVMMFILSNRNCDIGHIKAAFPELGNLEYDLSILFWFWTMAYRALSVLHDDEYLETVLDQAHGLVRDAAFRLCPSATSGTGSWTPSILFKNAERRTGLGCSKRRLKKLPETWVCLRLQIII